MEVLGVRALNGSELRALGIKLRAEGLGVRL